MDQAKRDWRVIVKEMARETDPVKGFELANELNTALQEQTGRTNLPGNFAPEQPQRQAGSKASKD
jgi:hypothetical protein